MAQEAGRCQETSFPVIVAEAEGLLRGKLHDASTAMIVIEEQVAQHETYFATLRKRAMVLLAASEVSPDIRAALVALDRRKLGEISKLGRPPSLVQQALKVVWMLIDVFGDGVDSSRLDVVRVSGAAGESPSKVSIVASSTKEGAAADLTKKLG